MSAEPVRTASVAAALVIPPRFCGPPGSGNGGYVAARLAALAGIRGTVEVTLRRPTPLATPLRVVVDGASAALEAPDGERLAEARAVAGLPREVPALRLAAVPAPVARPEHPVPGCFGCGPDHARGLRILPAPVAGTRLVAARWTPQRELAGPDGRVDPAVVWAALDCPGWFALHGARPLQRMLLGRITASVGPLRAGEPCVVVAWPIASEGRRHDAATALLDAAGRVLASSRQVWIVPRAEERASGGRAAASA